MFHTFNLAEPTRHRGSSGRPKSASESLAKRRQKVARACERCRAFRIKCGEKPCVSCVNDKVKCVFPSPSWGEEQDSTAPALARVRAVSPPTKNSSSEEATGHVAIPKTPTARVDNSAKSSHSPRPALVISTKTATDEVFMTEDYKKFDVSNCAFAEIDAFFADSRATSALASGAGGALLEGSHSDPFPDLPHTTVEMQGQGHLKEPLMEDQQRYFLRLFWEAYHPLVQASDEVEFRSLLNLDQQASEKQDLVKALTDCMTALGIQYGHGAGLAPRTLSLVFAGDLWRIGCEYFHRCRNQIASLNPLTLVSMQCYALMALYLLNSANFGEAYSLLGTAIRNCHRANLHQEPQNDFQPGDRIARRRIWWLLYTLDVRCSMQLGKPVAIQSCAITCAIPSEGELAAMPGNAQLCWKNLNVSTYFIHAARLAVSAGEIKYLILKFQSRENASNIPDIEQWANVLAISLGSLEDWRNQLPKELLSPRKDVGFADSMSVKESPVVLEAGAPNWVHHQRLLLEVYYHNAYVILQRPFICLRQAPDVSSIEQKQIDQHCRNALQHAIAMTIIIHDVCSLSNVLFGWSEILHPLWNAAMTMFAFVIARPFCWRSLGAKQSILKVVAVFEAFATTEPFAAQAKEITQSLVVKLNRILAELDRRSNQSQDSAATLSSMPQSSYDWFSSTPNSADEVVQPLGEDELVQISGETIFVDDGFASWEGATDNYPYTLTDY